MAWYEGGNWENLRVDRLGHCLAQMMYAINERQAILGRTLPIWFYVEGTYPQAWQLDGRRIDQIGPIITNIRQQTEYLFSTSYDNYFVKETDGTTWTLSDLLTPLGFGSTWLPLTRPTDLNIYLQLKGAIERLKYLLQACSVLSRPTLVGEDTASTLQTAYTGAIADLHAYSSAEYESLSTTAIRVTGFGGSTTESPRVLLVTQGDLLIGPITISGRPFRVFADVRDIHNLSISGAVAMDPIEVSLNGQSYALEATSNSAKVTRVEIEGPFDTATGGSGTFGVVPVEYIPPSTNPFPALGLNQASVRALINSGEDAEIITELQPGTDLTYG
jgi:hypothetical protein